MQSVNKSQCLMLTAQPPWQWINSQTSNIATLHGVKPLDHEESDKEFEQGLMISCDISVSGFFAILSQFLLFLMARIALSAVVFLQSKLQKSDRPPLKSMRFIRIHRYLLEKGHLYYKLH